MIMIVSCTVSLPWFRNNGTEKSFATDIFSLANQNSFAKNFSLFQFSRSRLVSLISTPIMYETKTFFSVTCPPCCINPKVIASHVQCCLGRTWEVYSCFDTKSFRLKWKSISIYILSRFDMNWNQFDTNMKVCPKNFPLPITSHYHWTWIQKRVTDKIWNHRAWIIIQCLSYFQDLKGSSLFCSNVS